MMNSRLQINFIEKFPPLKILQQNNIPFNIRDVGVEEYNLSIRVTNPLFEWGLNEIFLPPTFARAPFNQNVDSSVSTGNEDQWANTQKIPLYLNFTKKKYLYINRVSSGNFFFRESLAKKNQFYARFVFFKSGKSFYFIRSDFRKELKRRLRSKPQQLQIFLNHYKKQRKSRQILIKEKDLFIFFSFNLQKFFALTSIGFYKALKTPFIRQKSNERKKINLCLVSRAKSKYLAKNKLKENAATTRWASLLDLPCSGAHRNLVMTHWSWVTTMTVDFFSKQLAFIPKTEKEKAFFFKIKRTFPPSSPRNSRPLPTSEHYCSAFLFKVKIIDRNKKLLKGFKDKDQTKEIKVKTKSNLWIDLERRTETLKPKMQITAISGVSQSYRSLLYTYISQPCKT